MAQITLNSTGVASNGSLVLQSNGTTAAVTVDTSQNVGVGVTPSAWGGGFRAEDVGGAAAITSSTAADVWYNAYNNGTNSIYKNGGFGASRFSQDNGAFKFYNAPSGTAGNAITFTQAMTLTEAGNLLVGATDIPTTVRTKGFAAKSSSSGGISIYQTTNVSDWGITATSGSIVNFYSDTGSALTFAGSISVNGNVTTYGSVSDYRLKENIVPMTNALSKVQALNPVTFTFKDSGQTSQGFIAHELQAVIPDAVTGEKDAVDEDGNPKYQGIDTSFLVATLTAAIQEQQALITQLTARITDLESA